MSKTARMACFLAAALIATACGGGGGSSSRSQTGNGTPTTTASKGADPGDQSAGNPADAGYTPTGTLIADSGFRPETNGFKFENYGSTLDTSGETVTNMTADDVRQMFGAGVCADAQSGKCDLTPEAQSWMDQANSQTSGGHCEGFSIASLLLWAGKLQPDPLGASSVPDLSIEGNTALQRQIAYNFLFQYLPSVTSAQVNGTPNDILNVLKNALKPNPSEAYTIGIYKADHTGGHAVTPYAIEDKGGGIQDVLIYDNNWPGKTREITFDTNANKWSYDAATNPNEPSEQYLGDSSTGTIELDPAFPGLGVQPCPFCNKVPDASGGTAAGTPELVSLRKDNPNPDKLDEIWLDGSDTDHGHLLITDPSGHQLGIVRGQVVNQIPGAQIDIPKSDRDWKTLVEPTYYVPDGVKYSITVDGTALNSADDTSIGVIGPSFDAEVADINLNPGEKDTFTVSPDATQLSYASSRSESPTISVGVSDDTADYTFEISGASDQPGSTLNMSLPAEGSSLSIDTAATGGTSNVTLKMTREDDNGKAVFKHDGISLSGGDQATLDFGNWSAGGSLPLHINHAGSETTETLVDQGG